MNKEIVLKGKVVSGSGKGKHFVNLPWVKRQIKMKLGFNPYIGTLNVKLSNEKDLTELENSKGIIIEPEKGYYTGKCFHAIIMKKVKGAVVIPEVPNYPTNVLEIIAPINLRKTLGIEDGVIIEIKVSFS